MNRGRWLGNALLCFTSVIWGTSFVASVKGLRILPPYAFNMYRFLLAFLFILGIVVFFDALQIKRSNPAERSAAVRRRLLEWKAALGAGVVCGFFLFTASAFQQVGLQNTQAGKAAFITTLYIVIVPVVCLFLGKKIAWSAWIAVALGSVGLYLLSVTEAFSIALPDLLVLIGAFFWAGHILSCDYFVQGRNALKVSAAQFFFACLFFMIFTVVFEEPCSSTRWRAAFPAAFFAGLIACGVGFTLQIVAQQYTSPTVTALILSMESVFAVLAGYVFLAETLSPREMAGCILIFIAITLTQLPIDLVFRTKKVRERNTL